MTKRIALLIAIITFIGCYLIAPIIIEFILVRFNVMFGTDKLFLHVGVAAFIAASVYLILMLVLHKSEK